MDDNQTCSIMRDGLGIPGRVDQLLYLHNLEIPHPFSIISTSKKLLSLREEVCGEY